MNYPWYLVLFHVTLPGKLYSENPKKGKAVIKEGIYLLDREKFQQGKH